MKIALIGKKHVGKSALAEILCNEHSFEEYAIAQPIKDIGRILGFKDHELYKHKTRPNKHLAICAREFCQTFGTEFGRKFNTFFPDSGIENIWIHLLCKRLTDSSDLIVSDIRYNDELDLFREYAPDGIVFKIERPSIVSTDKYSSHCSETQIDSIVADYTIYNTGSVKDLYYSVLEALDDLTQ